MNPAELGAIKLPVRISVRRMLGGGIFGLVYGGAFITGINYGARYVSKNPDYFVADTLYLGMAVHGVSIVLIGILAGYVARSGMAGFLTAAFGSTLFLFPPTLLFDRNVTGRVLLGGVYGIVLVGAALAASVASRREIEQNDIEMGLVLGVSWKHWLWLWLPFVGFVGNIVWLGTPRFILLRTSMLYAVTDILGSAIGVCIIIYGGYRALGNLRVDAPVTRSPEERPVDVILADLAVDSWRFSNDYKKVLLKLDANEQRRFANKFLYYRQKLEICLSQMGMTLVNLEGQRFEIGSAAEALNLEEFSTEDVLVVDQMLEPVIVGPNGIIRVGKVMVRKAMQ